MQRISSLILHTSGFLHNQSRLGLTSLIPQEGAKPIISFLAKRVFPKNLMSVNKKTNLFDFYNLRTLKNPPCGGLRSLIAEKQGFEPWDPSRGQRFSRPPRSTTPASLLYSLLLASTVDIVLF